MSGVRCLACSILLVLRAASSLCPQRLSQSSQFSVDAWHLSAAVMACSHRGRCSRIKRVAAGQSVPCRAPDRTSHLAQSGRAALTRRGQARGEGRGGGSRDSFSFGSRVWFSVGGYGLAIPGLLADAGRPRHALRLPSAPGEGGGADTRWMKAPADTAASRSPSATAENVP